MSFSGLKTAVLTAVEKVRAETGNDEIPEQTRNDICRAFQDAVVDVLAAKSQKSVVGYRLQNFGGCRRCGCKLEAA